VGNPYLTNLSASAFLAANTAVEGTVYFWEDANSDGIYTSSDYAAWNGAGSVGTGGSKTPNGTIGVAQGFYVRKSAAGSSTLSFTNAMRSTSAPVHFKSIQNESAVYRIKLSVENGYKHYSETLIAFKEDATDSFDSNYDAYKLPGGSDVVLFSTLDNRRMSIQTFGTDSFTSGVQIPLHIELKKTGAHKIKVLALENFTGNFELNIEDKVLNQFVTLSEKAEFKFNTDKIGLFDNRFVLHVKRIQQTILTDNSTKKSDVYFSNGTIHLANSSSDQITAFSVYSITGHLLETKAVNADETAISLNLPKGIYITVLKYRSNAVETHKIAVY
ncbi:MAG TPA: hypothetical protein DCQ31_17355, partial [Bacteroidales bacterium]|nr:hypothetical protein [Bacteroidales bacterium]